MTQLEHLTRGAIVKGILPNQNVTVIDTQWHGSDVLEVTYKDANGQPNRLEQRFGRIHRIGQTEVCHLWNLVAEETREGDVYLKLLQKLEVEQTALGGKIFDVLGKAIAGKELRELLIEAIRYGDRADVKAKLNQAVTERVERERLQALLEERALARDSMDATKIQKIRESMERAEARKVQPYFIASFFLEAFQRLGGTIRQRESRRYEITHVPAVIRNRDQIIGMGSAIMRRYERICFQKELISVSGKPLAEFVCPGHPLLNATIDLILERHRDLLRQGAILIDENILVKPCERWFIWNIPFKMLVLQMTADGGWCLVGCRRVSVF